MGWLLEVLRCIKPSTYAVVLLSLALMTTLLTANLSLLHTLYNLYDEIAFPSGRSSAVVVTGFSVAPFTSIISVGAVEQRLRGAGGVYGVVYEVLSIASIDGSAIVVRGVRREGLRLLTSYSVAEGEDVSDDCMYCAWISTRLAERLGLGVGSYVVLHSPFTAKPFVLQIRGVLRIGGPYAHELIVPIDLARAIRGMGRGQVSIAVVLLAPGADRSLVLRRFNVSSEELGLFEKALIALRARGKRISPAVYTSAAELFMARIGLHRDVFLAVTIAIAVLTSAGCYIVGNAAVLLNRENLYVLHVVGLPKRRAKAVLALLVLVAVLALLPVATQLSKHLLSAAGLRILGYPLTGDVDMFTALAVLASAYLFTAMGICAVDIDEG